MKQLELQFEAAVPVRAVEELVAEAAQVLQEHHGAWLVGDRSEADRQRTRLRKIAEQINLQHHGDPRFGTLIPGGGEWTLEQALKAPDGHIPLRGQPGRFLLTSETFRAVVSYPHLLSRTFDVHAIDLEHPFISSTGYRSFATCRTDQWDTDPAELARAAISEFRMAHPSTGKPLTSPAPLVFIDHMFREVRSKELLQDLAGEHSGWLVKALAQRPPAADRVGDLVARPPTRARGSRSVVEDRAEPRSFLTTDDDLQQYFNFDTVALPAAKQPAALVAIRAAASVSHIPYDLSVAGGATRIGTERAEALRGWRGLVEGNTAEVAAALSRSGGTVSNLLVQYIKGGIPGFDIRGAIISSPADLAAFCLALRTPYFESLKIAILDNRNQVIHSEVASVGSLNETVASPQVFSRVLASARRANPKIQPAGFVIAHNHPSGNPNPSDADRRFTTRMEELGELMGLPLIDHVITNGVSHYSFREVGLIRGGMAKRSHGKPRLPVLPIPTPQALADWEVVTHDESLPRLDTPPSLDPYLRTLRTADPDHHHAIYLNAQFRLMAAERLPATLGSRDIAQRMIEGSGRNGGFAVAFGFADSDVKSEPTSAMRSLVREIAESMALAQIELVDAMLPISQSPGRTLGYFSWRVSGLIEAPSILARHKLSEPEMAFHIGTDGPPAPSLTENRSR